MLRFVALLALCASSADAKNQHLCENATVASAALGELYTNIKAVQIACYGKKSLECALIEETLRQFKERERGLGLVALSMTQAQACKP